MLRTNSIFLSIVFCILYCTSLIGQQRNLTNIVADNESLYLTPELSIGYTFNGSINFGVDLNAGLKNVIHENSLSGISYSYRLMKFDGHFHRHHSMNFNYQNIIADLKLGLGRTKVRSGYRNIRRCYAFGLTTNLSLKYPNSQSPKIGFHSFFINRGWQHFKHNYHTVYVGYDFNNPLSN